MALYRVECCGLTTSLGILCPRRYTLLDTFTPAAPSQVPRVRAILLHICPAESVDVAHQASCGLRHIKRGSFLLLHGPLVLPALEEQLTFDLDIDHFGPQWNVWKGEDVAHVTTERGMARRVRVTSPHIRKSGTEAVSHRD